jgi:hypothetical protein
VIRDRGRLASIEYPLPNETTKCPHFGGWGVRFRNGVQSEQSRQRLRVESIGLETRLGDESGPVGVGEGDRGPGGLGGIVEVLPKGAGLENDVLWTRESVQVVDQLGIRASEPFPSGLV